MSRACHRTVTSDDDARATKVRDPSFAGPVGYGFPFATGVLSAWIGSSLLLAGLYGPIRIAVARTVE